MTVVRTKLTPPEVARMWGISPDKVLAWIRSGELRAINVAASQNGRPRYRIDIEDLKDFEARRSVIPAGRMKRGRRRKQDGVIEFF